MPFWEAIKSCQHCRHWRRTDPSDKTGICEQQTTIPQPFWHLHDGERKVTFNDQGTDCDTYSHLPDDQRPHPLDQASAYMAGVQAGDRITVRTYSVGQVSRLEARVQSYHRGFAVLNMMNRSYRMRLQDSKRGRAGTIIGLPDWGLDVDAPVMRAKRDTYDVLTAVGMLASIKVGDWLPLIDIINGTTHRRALVTAVSKQRISFTIDGRRRWMHREAPMAGVIDGELWTLDLTNASETQATP